MTDELHPELLNTGRLHEDAEMVYRVRAHNTAHNSENKIHDDEVAARYGFRGGLVPGVTIYAYMTEAVVSRFPEWLEQGSMQVKFQKPFYEDEFVCVHTEVNADNMPVKLTIKAEREDGEVCAIGSCVVNNQANLLGETRLEDYPESALPEPSERPIAAREHFLAGAPLGSLETKIDLRDLETTYLKAVDERLSCYYGEDAVAHPGYLLGLANEIFVRNFQVSPWIHVGSELQNFSTLRHDETLSVRGRIHETFERKGFEFVVLDILAVANQKRLVQQVRHTAIYKMR